MKQTTLGILQKTEGPPYAQKQMEERQVDLKQIDLPAHSFRSLPKSANLRKERFTSQNRRFRAIQFSKELWLNNKKSCKGMRVQISKSFAKFWGLMTVTTMKKSPILC